jgi:hypothetical protein
MSSRLDTWKTFLAIMVVTYSLHIKQQHEELEPSRTSLKHTGAPPVMTIQSEQSRVDFIPYKTATFRARAGSWHFLTG